MARLDGAFPDGAPLAPLPAPVERAGTIRAAGREVGWNYCTCLNRVQAMEHVLGAAVLVTTRGGVTGGGARLSHGARRLMKLFDDWRRAALRSSDVAFRNVVRPCG